MPGNVNWRTFVNEKLTGRKINRWLTTGICFAIGLAFVNGFWRWSMGESLPPLPGETLFIASLPFIMSGFDNWMKTSVTRTEIHANAPSVNPHGGPDAP